MKKLLAAVLLAFLVSPVFADDYSADRAKIENLMAKYIFALDWQDGEAYASTFTEDGVLDSAGGMTQGRKALREMVEKLRAAGEKRRAEDKSGLRPSRARHTVSNVFIEVDGNTARARAYWLHYNNNSPDRKGAVDSFGHYEDDLVKQNGQWLFKKRHVFNEQRAERAATDRFPLTK
jgi:uncharacterized protein (TIGR02246 family)